VVAIHDQAEDESEIDAFYYLHTQAKDSRAAQEDLLKTGRKEVADLEAKLKEAKDAVAAATIKRDRATSVLTVLKDVFKAGLGSLADFLGEAGGCTLSEYVDRRIAAAAIDVHGLHNNLKSTLEGRPTRAINITENPQPLMGHELLTAINAHVTEGIYKPCGGKYYFLN